MIWFIIILVVIVLALFLYYRNSGKYRVIEKYNHAENAYYDVEIGYINYEDYIFPKVEWEYENTFNSKEEAIKYIETQKKIKKTKVIYKK